MCLYEVQFDTTAFLYLTSCMDYPENKTHPGWWCTLHWKDRVAGTHFPVFFSKPALLSLCSSRRGWRQTDSTVKCGSKQAHPPWLDWQAHSLWPLSVLYCTLRPNATHTHTDSHTGQLKTIMTSRPNLSSYTRGWSCFMHWISLTNSVLKRYHLECIFQIGPLLEMLWEISNIWVVQMTH